MKTSEWDFRFPHFAPEEFFSPEGLVIFHQKNIIPCDTALVFGLESLRTHLNWEREEGIIKADKEITLVVNSGNRRLRGFVTPREWVYERPKTEGQLFSFHLFCAADVSSPEVTPRVIFDAASFPSRVGGGFGFRGIVEYSWGVHLDRRCSDVYVKGKN